MYKLKIYVNKEEVKETCCLNFEDAVREANYWEDMGFVVEILIYENSRIISREIWREQRIDNE